MNPPGSGDPATTKPNPFARATRPADPRNPARDNPGGTAGPTGKGSPGPDGGPADRFLTPAPTVSLPQGGGAIRGIGETFQANAVTGTANLSVPITVTPSPRGPSPELTLAYDSGAGNTPFGLGWQLATASIRRKTDRGLPRYHDTLDAQGESDVFQLAGAEDLVPWLDDTGAPILRTATEGPDTYLVVRFRPRLEGAFTRIERWMHTFTGDLHWRTHTGDNTRQIFGRSPSARVADPDAPHRVFAWLLEEVRDELGHLMRFTYKVEDRAGLPTALPAERPRTRPGHRPTYTYLKEIHYGNKAMGSADAGFHFKVVFDYGEHTADPPTPTEDATWPYRYDPFSSFRPGFDHRCYRLCRRVLVFHDFPELGAGWTLVRATELTHELRADATRLLSVRHRGYQKVGETYVSEALPAVSFTYTEPALGDEVRFVDGVEDLPTNLDIRQYQWVDLDGEGLTGLLTEHGGAWYFKPSDGEGRLRPIRRLGQRPAVSLQGAQLMDLDGDGKLDVVQLNRPPKGYFAGDADGGWQPFRPFKLAPNFPVDGPMTRFVDLDGDGIADLLALHAPSLFWYPSKGKDGFVRGERIPRPPNEDEGPLSVFATGDEHLLFADMTGDGLSDLVRIRRTSVEYWPNRGYGRFGARIVLDGAPCFDQHGRFDARRIRLADVDGTGTTDLIYLGVDGVDVYLNEAGNAVSPRHRLRGFPPIDDVSQVSVTDVLGDGTACLVWSSPLLRGSVAPLRYVRLMKHGKPHLLAKVDNGLGRTTTLSYTPSTVFYAADRRAGRPWATKLPFPVQCLSRVEVRDAITGWRFASTYSYHHGYFDGPEREFRGFGLVVQRDTESVTDFEGASNGDVAHHLAPVVTKTWFHTGAWQIGKRLTDAFRAEAWAGDALAKPLPSPSIPPAMTPEDQREAHRAFKGVPLRVEVYAEDGSADADKPYVVTESTYTVRRVQHRRGQRQSVFQMLPSQTRTAHYERNAADPRVSHELVLETDSYGQVLKSASVGYKRRAAQIVAADPPAPVDVEQGRTHVVVTTASFVHDDAGDATYHLAVPTETATWALTGVDAEDSAPFTVAGLLAALEAAAEIAHETPPTGGTTVEKRLLARTRTLYWDDALTGPLGFGEVGARELTYQAYQQVYTAGMVGASGAWGDIGAELGTGYDRPTTSGSGNDLELAGYVQPFAGNTDWWRPSGTMTRDPAAFYQPIAHEDPFGNETTLGYDDHDLFVVEVTDAVGNVVEAAHDYRTLAPWQITDPNGAKQQVAFDALGRVVKLAVIGTATPTPEGDTLTDPTVQFTYEVDRWAESALPNRVKVEHREVHGAAGFQVQYAYNDGGGQVVMTKVKAKQGLAPERDEHGALVFVDEVLQFAEADPRWIGTGRTVLDNKGNVVKQFEPFFSSTHEYEDDDDLVAWGVTPVMSYDPLGRQIRVDHPDGTFQTVFFDPWRSEVWDGADNVDGSAWHLARESTATPTPSAEDQRAATLSLAHAATPTITHLDALGRAIVTIEDLGDDATVQTTLTLDLAGHVLTVQGEKGRTTGTPYVDQAETYDMLGRPMRSASADAGLSWALLAADDKPIRTFREGPICVHAAYDALRRPTALKVQEGAGITATRTHEKLLYGEASGAPSGAGSYHRGRVWKTWDGAGLVEVVAYDFKGHAVEVARQLVALEDVDKTIDWDATPGAGIAALETSETFTTEQRFDALDRVVEAVTPDGSVTSYAYNTAGLLESVDVNVRGASTATAFVESIDYDEKGRRTQIGYGNGTTTTHTYDPLTFRLTRLKTTRASDSAVLQDLRYFYDAVGNIVEVQDDAQQTEFFANAVVSPTQKYEYDALYRLVNAKGRQKQSMSGIPNHVDPSKGGIPDGTTAPPGAMSTYERRYSYDGVGNILEMKQVSAWTRAYTYAADSNRLASTTEAGGTKSYRYNARGAMTSMAHLDFASTGFDDPMVSDFRDQLAHVTLNSGGDTVRFHYAPTRERVRKVWTKGAIVEERVYLGGWELWRKHNGSGVTDERETLHVLDGESRIAMVETLTVSGGSTVGSPSPVSRFQLGNHLGSACLELDADGELLTYEEFFPYGSTSWWAERSASPVSHKRYRYIGKEKDEETGLHYHSARYLAGWLGRWTSSDPAGLVDGVGRYSYVGGQPTRAQDSSGLAPDPPPSQPTRTATRLLDSDATQTARRDQAMEYMKMAILGEDSPDQLLGRLIDEQPDFLLRRVLPELHVRIAQREFARPSAVDPKRSAYHPGERVRIAGPDGGVYDGNHCIDLVNNSAYLAGYDVSPQRFLKADGSLSKSAYWTSPPKMIPQLRGWEGQGKVTVVIHHDDVPDWFDPVDVLARIRRGDVLLWGDAGRGYGHAALIIEDWEPATRRTATGWAADAGDIAVIEAGGVANQGVGKLPVAPANRPFAVYRYVQADWSRVQEQYRSDPVYRAEMLAIALRALHEVR